MQAIDDDCNQTGQMTAAFLDWPQVNIIRKPVLIICTNKCIYIQEC